MKTLTYCIALLKAVPEYLLRLTDFSVRAQAGFFSKLLVYCESGFRNHFVSLLAGFIKPDMTVNTGSSSSAACRKGFHIITGSLKPGKNSLYRVFS